jgi:predicted nucleic-acid-binding protein
VIAVDTNVLVRLLVSDDMVQAAKARQLFDWANEQGKTIWVSDTVLVELAWTLAKAYGRQRADIVKALRTLSSHATVVLESVSAVRDAIETFAAGPADFADCLLCAKAGSAGYEAVATFDRGMKALPTVRVL